MLCATKMEILLTKFELIAIEVTISHVNKWEKSSHCED